MDAQSEAAAGAGAMPRALPTFRPWFAFEPDDQFDGRARGAAIVAEMHIDDARPAFIVCRVANAAEDPLDDVNVMLTPIQVAHGV